MIREFSSKQQQQQTKTKENTVTVTETNLRCCYLWVRKKGWVRILYGDFDL